MKERYGRGRQRLVVPSPEIVSAPAVTPDALAEFAGLSTREWKTPEFEDVHWQLKRYEEEHPRLGNFASADVSNFEGFEAIEPYLLVLDVTPHPLDFTYIEVGEHVGKENGRPLIGHSINSNKARNMRKYGIYGHQAEMFCLYMDTYLQGGIFATSRNMTVCTNDYTGEHQTKDIDVAAVRASTNGLFPDKIISVAMISPTRKN